MPPARLAARAPGRDTVHAALRFYRLPEVCPKVRALNA